MATRIHDFTRARRTLRFAVALGVLAIAGCSSSDQGSSDASGGKTSGSAGSSNAVAGSNGAGTSSGAGNNNGGSTSANGGASGANNGGASGANNAGATSSGGTNNGGAAGSTPGPTGPRFIGRFDMTNPNAPVAEWSGSAISLRFTGTSIGVTLSDGASDVFEVIIDGQQSVVPSIGGTNKYTLGSGLSNGPHDLLIYKRTEAFFGDMAFGGFDIDPSAYLAGDPVPTRRIELIGDSISAGYGDEGMNPCMFMPSTENQYLSYGPLAARALNADLYTEAWSGIGMVSNSGGDTTMPTMPERYGKTLPVKDAMDTWDFSKYTPDAVVINLGTNDFSAGDPGMNFQTTYTSFVTMLRGHYANARIYLAVGPMLGGGSYTQAKTYLNGVISARASAGDKNLALLEFGTQDAADGLGCDSHPSLKTHQKMADKLETALK
ncbi:MAG TPA: SGNH/GDSL hydrolase family protein, partial [Polyangiaceae bacterium]|nr:SGNH/GDSL hydrolase family protein [Polyangiaceae bacterium]